MRSSLPVTETRWRQEYRQHRYLEFASPQDLHDRLSDIVVNAYTIDRNGKYQMIVQADQWCEKLTHLKEEITLRQIELSSPPLLKYTAAIRAAELWDSVDVSRGDYLLKFGKREHMADLLSKGRLRICEPEHYADSRFNSAIFDTECEFLQESIGATIKVPPGRDYSIPQDQWLSGPVLGTLKRTSRYEGRAYIACFAMKYEFRLFEDFEANSCVVIRDPLRFLRAIKEWSDVYLADWVFSFDHVAYRDPFQPTKEVDVLYTKHFKYSYQREFRMAWEQDKNGQPPPEPTFIELGPLTNYCDLLVL